MTHGPHCPCISCWSEARRREIGKQRHSTTHRDPTAAPSTYVEPFQARPPWWRDAEYHWSGRDARPVPPTEFRETEE